MILHINSPAIIGKTFTAFDPKIEYTCLGYGQNDTFLLVGSWYDAPNDRTHLKTFKLSDVKFKGQLTPVP